MTRTTKLLIPVVLVAAAVAAYWFLVLAPKREEITKLDADIATQDAAAMQAEQLAATYQKAKDNYRVNYATVARLGKAVPADDDVRSLLVQLDATAKRSKVAFRSLSLAGGGAAPDNATGSPAPASGELAPAPGAVPVGSAGFSAMPFSFTFSGSFFRLSDFFTRLERFVTVQNENIDVSGPAAAPRQHLDHAGGRRPQEAHGAGRGGHLPGPADRRCDRGRHARGSRRGHAGVDHARR